METVDDEPVLLCYKGFLLEDEGRERKEVREGKNGGRKRVPLDLGRKKFL